MNTVIRLRAAVEPSMALPLQLDLDFFAPAKESVTAKVIPFGTSVKWSEKNITDLREGILWDTLRTLADGRAGQTAKDDALEWLLSDDTHPFSYKVCCIEFGYEHTKLREQTLALLARLKRGP